MTRNLPDDAPRAIGRLRIKETLVFVSKASANPVEREHVELLAGEVVDLMYPNDADRKDMAAREKAGRPSLVVILWNGMRRLVPESATDRLGGQR